MRYKKIEVFAGRTRERVEDGQADDVRPFDTVKEAKAYAKYALTDAKMRSDEASEPMMYSQVVADGEVLADFERPSLTS